MLLVPLPALGAVNETQFLGSEEVLPNPDCLCSLAQLHSYLGELGMMYRFRRPAGFGVFMTWANDHTRGRIARVIIPVID